MGTHLLSCSRELLGGHPNGKRQNVPKKENGLRNCVIEDQVLNVPFKGIPIAAFLH